MLKFNCLIVEAISEQRAVWRNAAERDVFAISSQRSLLLQFETVERTEVVMRSIPVCLEYSCVISLRLLSERQNHELIVKTIDADYCPDGSWWPHEHTGLLISPSFGSQPSITFQVVIRFQEYILIDCSI